jgi:hypothetical protein
LQELFFNINADKDIRFQNKMLSDLLIETIPDLTEMAKNYYLHNKEDNDLQSEKSLPEYKLLFKNLYKSNSSIVDDSLDFLNPFLVVIPTDNEIQRVDNQEESIADFLFRFECSMKRTISDKVYIPYYYLDFIETMDNPLVFLKSSYLRILLYYKPNGGRNKIVIPKSIESLLDFDMIYIIMWH